MPRKKKKTPLKNGFHSHIAGQTHINGVIPTPGLRVVWRDKVTHDAGECLGIIRRGKIYYALVPFESGGITEIGATYLSFFRGPNVRYSLWSDELHAKHKREAKEKLAKSAKTAEAVQ